MAGEVSLTTEQIVDAVREGVLQSAAVPSVTDTISAVCSFGLLLFTAVLAWFTAQLVLEARKTRKFQAEPNVVVSAVHDLHRPSIIQLVIRNIGNGLAQNVRFETSRPLMVMYGLDEENPDPPRPVDKGPFVTGIPSLGPGDCRIMNWGQPGALKSALGEGAIDITSLYEFEGKPMPPTVCHVDVASFLGTVAHESIELRAVKALESIAKKTT